MNRIERHRLAFVTWRRLAYWQLAAAMCVLYLALICGVPDYAAALGVAGLVLDGGAGVCWWLEDRADARFQSAVDAEWEKIRKVLEDR